MRKTCNVYTFNRFMGLFVFAFSLTWNAHAAPDKMPFPSGYDRCEAAAIGSLPTLLDRTLKNFRIMNTAGKVKDLHLVAEVVGERAHTHQFSENEQMQLGLLLRMTLEASNEKLEPFATELLYISLKLTVNTLTPKSPLFEEQWEKFLKRVLSFETPGYSAHRASILGNLAMIELKKIQKEKDPSIPLQKAFGYIGQGWKEDYELTMHPTLMVIESALNTSLPEGSMPGLDFAMAGLIGHIEKSLIERKHALDQERFSQSYIWLVAQVETVSASPGLSKYPQLARKMIELRNAFGPENSTRH